MPQRSGPTRIWQRTNRLVKAIKRLTIGAALVVVLYALAGFLLAPYLIDRAVQRYAAARAEGSVRLAHVAVNPFTLSVTLQGLALRDAEAQLDLSADRAGLKLDIASLSGRRWLFTAVSLDGVSVLAPGPESRSRLADVIHRLTGPRASPSRPVEIAALQLRHGRLELAAGAAAALALKDVSLTAEHLVSDSAAGLRVGDAEISVQGLTLPLADKAALSADRLVASEVELTAWPLAADIGRIRLQAPRVKLDIAPSARIAPLPWLSSIIVPPAAAGLPPPYSVALERLELAGGTLELRDSSVTPAVSLDVHDIDGQLSGPHDDEGAAVELRGAVGESGSVTLSGRLRAGADGGAQLRAANVDATSLSPYAQRYAGHPVRAGALTAQLSYGARDGAVDGTAALSLHGLELDAGATGPPDGAGSASVGPPYLLPLPLAAALLEDPSGRIELSFPFAAQSSGGLPGAVGRALAAAISRTASAPFDMLGRLSGTDAARLRAVPFAPGSAALAEPATTALAALASALAQRPVLALVLSGGFDRSADRDALAAQQIRLHVALATAGASEFSPAQFGEPPPIDFTSPRAQDVLDEFAGERLNAEQLRSIASPFGEAKSQDPAARADYYRALFETLVAKEPISDTALSRLGRFRAQSIADALTGLGVAAERVELGGAQVPAGVANGSVLVPLGVRPLAGG